MANFDDPRLLFYSILNPITSLTSLKISCSPLLEGGKVALPPLNKGEQEMFRDDKDVIGFKME